MSEPRYRIIFSGKPLPETSVQTLQNNLVQLFQITPEKAAAMLSKGPRILKKDLSKAKAIEYLATLRQAGAAAQIEQELANPSESPAPSQTQSPHQQSTNETPNNPYAPPRARVADSETQEYGELNPWTVEGRIGRLRYLAWSNVLVLAAGFTSVSLAALLQGMGMESLFMLALIPLGCFAALCGIRIGAQRLHDMGLSAWFMLLYVIPVISLLLILALTFWPGSKEENDYGLPPPRNTTSVRILAFLWFFIVIIGILAAIVLPSYQDYVKRTEQVSAAPMSPPPAPAPFGR